jgi:hypothetical protein
MARGGRTRKAGKRHPGGKLIQPVASIREAEMKYIVRAQRYKRHIMEMMDDPRRGSMLGMEFLFDRIDVFQLEAGEMWNGLVRKYSGLTGMNLTPSVTAQMERIQGRSLHDDPTDKRVEQVKSDYEDAVAMLRFTEKSVGGSMTELSQVCVFDRPVSFYRGLHVQLTGLVLLWQLNHDEADKAHRTRITRYLPKGSIPSDRQDLRT